MGKMENDKSREIPGNNNLNPGTKFSHFPGSRDLGIPGLQALALTPGAVVSQLERSNWQLALIFKCHYDSLYNNTIKYEIR